MTGEILALVKSVGKPGKLSLLKNDLKVFNSIVKGYIEVVYLREDIVLICNEEGSLLNLDINIGLPTKKGFNIPIYGDIVIVGVDGEEFIGLNKEQIEFLKKQEFILIEENQNDNKIVEYSIGKKNPLINDLNSSLSVMFSNSGFLFNFILNDLRKSEIEALTKESMKIDLVYKEGVIFFIFNIPGLLSASDIAFTIHLCPEDCKKIESLDEGKGYACTIVLTEQRTGIIESMRYVSLSNNMSEKLNKCMKDQLERPFNNNIYSQVVDKLQRTYSAKELLRYSIAYSKFNR